MIGTRIVTGAEYVIGSVIVASYVMVSGPVRVKRSVTFNSFE